ncbi:hypothetical protein GCM10009857_23340 [Agromyces soli]
MRCDHSLPRGGRASESRERERLDREADVRDALGGDAAGRAEVDPDSPWRGLGSTPGTAHGRYATGASRSDSAG